MRREAVKNFQNIRTCISKERKKKKGPESNLWPANCRFGFTSTSLKSKKEKKKGSESKFN